MKIKTYILYILIFGLCPKVQATFTSMHKVLITGKLTGTTKGPEILYLFLDNKLTDSSRVTDRCYSFSISVSGMPGMTLASIKDSKSGSIDGHPSITLLIGKGNLNVSSTAKLSHVAISGTGAPLVNDYNEALTLVKLATDTLNALINSEEYSKNPKLRADVEIRTSYLNVSMEEHLLQYLSTHPKSVASGYIASKLYGRRYPDTLEIVKLISHLPSDQKLFARRSFDSFRKVKEAESLNIQIHQQAESKRKQALEEEVAIGKQAKDFNLPDSSGKMISLSSFKGKYIFIDFWASWCGPCRAENPNVQKVFDQYSSRGLTVIGISVDGKSYGSKKSWINAVKQDGMRWIQLLDSVNGDHPASKLYNVNAIPRNFLIDPTGKIIAKDLRGDDLQRKVTSILN
ncbi:peroxiredoxin family protein [Pedobacter miscanthi]|uniref:Thioredoxin domain-containing protein n=1 Tax=Pedobacter miscanthi TaxID=2259170 RepID=A0A366LDV3_9SPHI|nr:TlpA disulfide reductase family protein [Pedobacter miscanthi]RBQ12058.1 hypothetical protein DRW42_02025 [Pedobacter miscanthi]